MYMLKFDVLERSVAQKLSSLSKEVELQEERNYQYKIGHIATILLKIQKKLLR